MQRLHPERGSGGELNLLASHGFAPEAVSILQWVRADSNCSCRRRRAAVNAYRAECQRVRIHGRNEGPSRVYRQPGCRPAQSTPLISRSGNFRHDFHTLEAASRARPRDLRLLDVLARQTADRFERMEEVADQLPRAKQAADDASRARTNS